MQFDELLRSLKQNKDITHSLLLGAGASVESGIPSASDCIWDWKHEIFISRNPTFIDSFKNSKMDNVRFVIQKWLDSENVYPENCSHEEYSFYAEKSLPIEDDRRKYFQHLLENKKPSMGYHLISMLAETGWIKSVWTTNFDGLMVKTAYQYDLTPIEVTLESQERIYRNGAAKELLCVALHGDYKYGPLRNTATELDSQSDILINALKHELSSRNIIVLGYSGRDNSLMAALKEAYSQPCTGRLYWCGYGNDCPPAVEELLAAITSQGKQAFYIPTDGFDRTMLAISTHCMSENDEFIRRIDLLKNTLGAQIDLTATSFLSPEGIRTKIVRTNMYPISFPSTCFQFKLSYLPDEKPWNYCKALAEQDIIAVPYRELTYAWGSKQTISQICSNRDISNITVTPFTKDLIQKNSVFLEMFLRAVTSILGKRKYLAFSKNCIWDINQPFSFQIDGTLINAYFGIQLSIVFENNLTCISFTPAYCFRDSDSYTSSVKKQFADHFQIMINAGKPNLNINNYIEKWVKILTDNSRVNITYPANDSGGFNFSIGNNSALVGVNSNTRQYAVLLPDFIDKRRIVFNGIECRDPDLIFYDPIQKKMVNDFHPMRGITNNSPYDTYLNNNVLRSSINIGVLCPSAHNETFYSFISQLNSIQPVKYNVDYVIPYPGFFNSFKTGLNIPVPNSVKWLELQGSLSTDTKSAAKLLGQTINQKLEQLNSAQIDVVLIFIPKEYEHLTGFTDDIERFDLHDFVKAYAVQNNIATQFIREKTIDSDMRCQIMWALSLAIYAKSCRIPWIISDMQSDTAFAGIGYSINKSEKDSSIIVGCSHIYSADGQGLKYKLSKINDVSFDKKKNPYLSENEAYKVGLNIKELFYRSFTDFPKRVVIHKRTPFRIEEINGIVKSLSSTGIKDIELLEINYEDDIKCIEFARDFSIDGFPVKRGLCFPLNNKTMLMYTHGIAPSIRNPSYRYIQGGKTIPLPLKIVKHYGNGNMGQIATEILGLSKMNWNSFELYSKLPCTIISSNEIARIGWLLSHYEGSIYDYRFFM